MTRSPAICILAPDPTDPHFAQTWLPQADLLRTPLEAAGMSVAFHPWTAPADLNGFDCILPLLAWGYHDRPGDWSDFLDGAAHLPLSNAHAVLRRNMDKRYLLALGERGAPIVPTLHTENATPADIEGARARFGPELIAKPPISAGAHGIIRLNGSDALPETALGHPLLIQPLMPAIRTEGEYSLFYFAGRFSHAIVKTVADGDFRVQIQHGGSARPAEPPAAAIAAAEAVLAAVAEPLLYARVDLIADGKGNYLLMELELIEPQLFLEHAADGGAAFARAVAAQAAG